MSPRITIEMLAIMVTKRFDELEANLRNDFRAELSREVSRLETKMDLRFDSLSNRIGNIEGKIDDLTLNKISRQEHDALAARVSCLEAEAI